VPAKESRQKWRELQTALDHKKRAIEKRKREAKPDFEQWLQETNSFNLSGPAPALHMPLNEPEDEFHGTFAGQSITWSNAAHRLPGPLGSAPEVSAGDAIQNASPTLSRSGKASYGAFVYLEQKPSGALFSRMNKTQGYRGWDLFLSDGRPTVHIIDQWPSAALKVTAKQALKPGHWHHVMAVFDGTQKGADAITLYVDTRKVEVEVNNNNLGSNIVADVPLRLGARSDEAGPVDTLSGGKVFLQDLRFYDRALSGVELSRLAAAGLAPAYLATAPDQRTNEQLETVYDLFLRGFDKQLETLQNELAQLKTEEAKQRQRGATTLIMEEKSDSEPIAHILMRGNYASKGAQVAAATPEALPSMASGLPRNRLGLARWLSSSENPLTARVTVNRIWSYLYGMGIVETTEDFGVQGTRPSNPELLDWLAVEFLESGWDLRHMIKLMVTSKTYRQSDVISPKQLEKDPLNKLFSRAPHIRLEAEQIRDQALAASGLLVRKVGGPPVRPYQPEGVWEAVAMKNSNTRDYAQDSGDGLYRRSVYTFWKRTAPPPTLEILNAPSREVFCTRRDRTDTPLQALVTMNDPQFIEAARELAATALRSGQTFESRVDVVSERLLARRLNSPEREIVRKLAHRALQAYQSDTESARSLITVGASKPDEKLDQAELAAWTLVASQIMNLDESLTK
jgi:hypothetical protein